MLRIAAPIALVLSILTGVCLAATDTLYLKPGDNLADSISRAPNNAVIVIKKGIHRMQHILPREGQTLVGEDGAVLNGSMIVTDFTQANGSWSAPVPQFTVTIFPKPDSTQSYCRAGYPRCTHAVDLYFDNRPLRHVAARGSVDDTSWYFDYDANRVYLGANPTGRTVELSRTAAAIEGDWTRQYPNHVTIRNLTIEKYANQSQYGVIKPQQGRYWHITRCTVRLNHGAGIAARNFTVVESCTVADNGQIGMKSGGDSSQIRHNVIARNNFAGYESGWEAGGSKFARTRGLRVIGNHVYDNNGPGLWTDIDNYGTLYDSNKVHDNTWAGIFHEISYDAVIRNNTVYDNGRGKPYYHGSQILVANSSGVEVHNNHIVNNTHYGYAITIIQQNRTKDSLFYYSLNNYVHHNDITHIGMHGISGGAGQHAPDTFFSAGANRFDYNKYHVPDIGAKFWQWRNGQIGWNDFRAAGQEAHGSVDTSLNQVGNRRPYAIPAIPAATQQAVSYASPGIFVPLHRLAKVRSYAMNGRLINKHSGAGAHALPIVIINDIGRKPPKGELR